MRKKIMRGGEGKRSERSKKRTDLVQERGGKEQKRGNGVRRRDINRKFKGNERVIRGLKREERCGIGQALQWERQKQDKYYKLKQ